MLPYSIRENMAQSAVYWDHDLSLAFTESRAKALQEMTRWALDSQGVVHGVKRVLF